MIVLVAVLGVLFAAAVSLRREAKARAMQRARRVAYGRAISRYKTIGAEKYLECRGADGNLVEFWTPSEREMVDNSYPQGTRFERGLYAFEMFRQFQWYSSQANRLHDEAESGKTFDPVAEQAAEQAFRIASRQRLLTAQATYKSLEPGRWVRWDGSSWKAIRVMQNPPTNPPDGRPAIFDAGR
jgi:hypothetical protein